MNDPESRLERAAESTLARLLARFGVPLLLTVLGFFLRDALLDLKATQTEQGRDIAAIKSDMRVVQTRLDTQVLQQVQTNTKNIEKLDDRVQRIERRLGEGP